MAATVNAQLTASARELLAWIQERPRTYGETMEAWTTHCPRLTVWEDALGDGLIVVSGRMVALTDAGRDAFSSS